MVILPDIISAFFETTDNIIPHAHNLFEVATNSSDEITNKNKKVVLITGPSGAGKDTLVNSLPADKFVRWRTWTTRAEIRRDELKSDPYIRVTRAEFEEEIRKNTFLEYNEYAGNLYGTHKREVNIAFSDGRTPVLRIDPRGALKFNDFFKKRQDPFHEAILLHFFVVPPNISELKRRLHIREQDSLKVAKRLEVALSDLPFAKNAHYLLISEKNKIDETVKAVSSFLQLSAK